MAKIKQIVYNTTKTKLIVFKSPNKKKQELHLSVNNQSVSQVRSTTFLGVVIDDKCKFNQLLCMG